MAGRRAPLSFRCQPVRRHRRAQEFVVLTPGAEMERFARAAGERSRWPIRARANVALAAKHGSEITRPLEDVAEATEARPAVREARRTGVDTRAGASPGPP